MPKEKKDIISKNNQSTSTHRDIMNDIPRVDLITEITEFTNHIQDKIERLDERMRFVNYKFEDVRYWFKRYSISIIYLATSLTLMEALMNSLNIEGIINIILKSFIKLIPLLLSSLISLIAALIKFNKYEEKIEDITRATEKCIITIAKLKDVKEELYFCKTVENFAKINERFIRDIYTEYLESNTNIERQLLDTDYAKYMKKVAKNDVKRATILITRNKELDCIGVKTEFSISNYIAKLVSKKSNNIIINKINNESEFTELGKITNNHRKNSLSAEHNNNKRPIPYRGGSPPLTKCCNSVIESQNPKKSQILKSTNLLNKKLNSNKILSTSSNNISYNLINNNLVNDNQSAAECIQQKWRNYLSKKDLQH